MTTSVRARLGSRILVMLLLIVTALAISAPPAQATITTPEKAMMNQINLARRARGLRTLSWSSTLSDRARVHTRAMVTAGRLFHSSNLAGVFSGYAWRNAGENVGYGASITSIFNAFMASPGHRANNLDPRYRVIGAGVAYRNGIPWITVEFYG